MNTLQCRYCDVTISHVLNLSFIKEMYVYQSDDYKLTFSLNIVMFTTNDRVKTIDQSFACEKYNIIKYCC